jgi:hypothetical protein
MLNKESPYRKKTVGMAMLCAMIVLIVERKNKLKKVPRPGFSVGASAEHPLTKEAQNDAPKKNTTDLFPAREHPPLAWGGTGLNPGHQLHKTQ